MSFLKDQRILITGGAGFLGSALVKKIMQMGVSKSALTIPRSRECDLRIWENCVEIVKNADIVIHLAARVGGIGYNMNNPGSLFYDNAVMGIQLMEAARKAGVKKFTAVGTICAYPKFTHVPFKESELWNGYPEETNAPYGLAKKMLLVQAQAYRQQYGFNAIYLLPVNLYGLGDNFDPESSHVIPALIKKFSEAVRSDAKTVEVWGTGLATREFLFVDDAAEAIAFATDHYDKPEPVNIGSGNEISIKDLANLIAGLTGFEGEIVWDSSKPDGQPQRSLDVQKSKDEFGFIAKTTFREGLEKTILWYNTTTRAGTP